MTLRNLAVVHWNLNNYDEAEKEFIEAWGIYKKLAKQDSTKYQPCITEILDDLGKMQAENNSADWFWRFAIFIRNRIIKQIYHIFKKQPLINQNETN